MSNIINRQNVQVTVNLNTLTGPLNPSIAKLPLNLRFEADSLHVKSITYGSYAGDIVQVVQVECNLTSDRLITNFINDDGTTYVNEHFPLASPFQTGELELAFLQSDTVVSSYLPQPLISAQNPQEVFGVVVLSLEFLKHAK